MRPRCCLRYLTRFGISIARLLSSLGRTAGLRLLQHLAVEHTDLHAAGSVGRERRRAREVDVGAVRVERHPALAIRLEARHLRAAETARARDADALRPRPHRRGDRLLHRATERHALLELLRDVLG